MIVLRPAEERGHANRGWLNAYHTFSFADYHDPKHMGFRSLRVMNEDTVAPGKGFGPHGHRDMEIVTYVMEGALRHKDSTGREEIVRPNMVQAMWAGTGVIHSEYNASATEPVHLLQIWIEPSAEDLEPGYQQFAYDPAEKRGRLRLIAGPDAQPGHAAVIRQDARVYACVVGAGEAVEHKIAPGRHAWVQCAQGTLSLNGQTLRHGDGAAISDEENLRIAGAGTEGGEFLLFDLA